MIAIRGRGVLRRLIIGTSRFLFRRFCPSPNAGDSKRLSTVIRKMSTIVANARRRSGRNNANSIVQISFVMMNAFLRRMSPSSNVFLRHSMFILCPNGGFGGLLQKFLSSTMSVSRDLIKIISSTASFQVNLSCSRRRNTTASGQFCVNVRLSRIFQGKFSGCKGRSSFASRPKRTKFSQRINQEAFLFFRICGVWVVGGLGESCSSSTISDEYFGLKSF